LFSKGYSVNIFIINILGVIMLNFKTILFSLLISLSLIGFSSCSKDDDSNPSSVQNSNTLTASISGAVTTNFVANSTVYVLQSLGGGVSQTVISGSSINGSIQDVIQMQLVNLPGGAQTLDLGNPDAVYGQIMFARSNNGNVQQHLMTNGSVNITVNSNSEIRGTFNCTTDATPGTETYVSLNGSFYCKKN
jgi:hypothetical protein